VNREESTGKFRLLSSPALICLLLAVATFLIYSPVRNYGFVNYDDSDYFFANPHVLGGLTWTNIKWAFTSTESANWHPLTWLSLMLDATLFGKGAAAPHLTNVLLHAANSILLFILFRRLTGAVMRSAMLAMIFALHPLHVESVAWVAERKDVLSAFFGLLSLLGYARYAANNQSPWAETTGSSWLMTCLSSPSYWLAFFFFACGLMSKPMLVTLPFVMLLLDFWPLGRCNSLSLPRLVIEKIPFFILSTIMSFVTYRVQQEAGAVPPLSRFPLGLRMENTLVSYARYLGKIFLPVNLATPYSAANYWPGLLVFFSLALFAALCVAAVVLRKKFPFAFTGWFWFAGMLVPVIGLVQVGGQAMADRYMYLPLIGILVMIAWGIGEICAKYQPSRGTVVFFATLLFLVCAVRARNQVSVWKDDGTLFGHALAVTKNNYVADLDYGFWFSQNGNPQQALHYYDDAVKMAPDDPTALYNAGNAFARLGRWQDAIDVYRHALEIVTNDPSVMDNLGFALAQNRQLPEATACFEAVLKTRPDSFGAHNNLATIYFIQGNYAQAAEQYRGALQLAPDNTRALINLGDTYARLRQKISASECYQHVLQLQPTNQVARARLQSLGSVNPD
jgi:protein O-mannosyl-transferase